jgi:hypothetical protein
MLQELCGTPELGQQERVSSKQCKHTCPHNCAEQTAVILSTEALISWSCFNLAICKECLLPDHYMPVFPESHSYFLVYDVTTFDDLRITQIFQYE